LIEKFEEINILKDFISIAVKFVTQI